MTTSSLAPTQCNTFDFPFRSSFDFPDAVDGVQEGEVEVKEEGGEDDGSCEGGGGGDGEERESDSESRVVVEDDAFNGWSIDILVVVLQCSSSSSRPFRCPPLGEGGNSKVQIERERDEVRAVDGWRGEHTHDDGERKKG